MKKHILVLFLISFCLSVVGQNSISFQTDLGYFSKIDYQGAGITEDNNIKTNFVVNFTHFIKPKFALEAGIGLSSYLNKIMLPNMYNASDNEVDSFGSGFEFRVLANNYEEEQKLLLATIPLRLRFEGSLVPKGYIFYGSIGGKYMIPVSQKNVVTANSIETSGYYPNNNLLVENVPKHGFYTQNDVKTTADSSFKSSFALAAELGVKLKSESLGIYIGGFLDYGLTDIRKEANTNESVIAYADADLSAKSNGVSTLRGIDHVRLISCGFQFRFALCEFK